MENITIRESIYDDIPSLLELLHELGRPKPQKNNPQTPKIRDISDYHQNHEYLPP